MENGIASLSRNASPLRMLIPIGLVLVVFGVMLLGFKSANYAQATGRITAVAEHVDAYNNRKGYDVDFTYAVNGAEYAGRFDDLSGSFSVGAEIAVFYDPDDPVKTSNIKTSPVLATVLIALGALTTGLGIVVAAKAYKKNRALEE